MAAPYPRFFSKMISPTRGSRATNSCAIGAVRSVEPSLTTITSMSLTPPVRQICSRASRHRWIVDPMLSSSFRAGITIVSVGLSSATATAEACVSAAPDVEGIPSAYAAVSVSS